MKSIVLQVIEKQFELVRGQDSTKNPKRCYRALFIPVFPLAAFLLATPAVAAPPGSYQKTCNNIRVSGSTLSANCENRNGGWQSTQLANYQQCVSDIENLNGSLRCNMGAPPPSGSYTRTCQGIQMAGTTLNASCVDSFGKWFSTSLPNVNQCVGDIANYNGKLAFVGGILPPGSYQLSCTNMYVSGYNLTADCRPRQGNTVLQLGRSTLVGFNTCRSTISNIDGYLSCSRGNADPPPGSYLMTCIYPVINGSAIASAQCERTDYSWAPTSLANTTNCSDIANHNGTLTCVQAAGGGGGGWTVGIAFACLSIGQAGTASCTRSFNYTFTPTQITGGPGSTNPFSASVPERTILMASKVNRGDAAIFGLPVQNSFAYGTWSLTIWDNTGWRVTCQITMPSGSSGAVVHVDNESLQCLVGGPGLTAYP